MRRRALPWILLFATGCYAEIGVGAVGGAVEPRGLSGGPAFTLAVGVYLEEEPRQLAGGVGAGGDFASLAFDSFDAFALATSVFGYFDFSLHALEPERLYLRWSSAASIGGGGVRIAGDVDESAMATVFSGVGLTWFFQDDLSFLSVAVGPYGMLVTNPGAFVGGQVRLRFGFQL